MYAFGNALRGYAAAGTAAQRDAAALSNRLAREKQQQRSRELRLTSLPPSDTIPPEYSPPPMGTSTYDWGFPKGFGLDPFGFGRPPATVEEMTGITRQPSQLEILQGLDLPDNPIFPDTGGDRQGVEPPSLVKGWYFAEIPEFTRDDAVRAAPPSARSDPFERESQPGGIGGF